MLDPYVGWFGVKDEQRNARRDPRPGGWVSIRRYVSALSFHLIAMRGIVATTRSLPLLDTEWRRPEMDNLICASGG